MLFSSASLKPWTSRNNSKCLKMQRQVSKLKEVIDNRWNISINNRIKIILMKHFKCRELKFLISEHIAGDFIKIECFFCVQMCFMIMSQMSWWMFSDDIHTQPWGTLRPSRFTMDGKTQCGRHLMTAAPSGSVEGALHFSGCGKQWKCNWCRISAGITEKLISLYTFY